MAVNLCNAPLRVPRTFHTWQVYYYLELAPSRKQLLHLAMLCYGLPYILPMATPQPTLFLKSVNDFKETQKLSNITNDNRDMITVALPSLLPKSSNK